jgi:hypothetical protein
VRWKPPRITELWAKIAYVLVAWLLLPVSLRYLLEIIGMPWPIIAGIDIAWSFVVVAFGSRVFRAHGEEIVPPRVWWRATGRPRAGFLLFGLFGLAALSAFLPYPEEDPALWWYLVTGLPIAAFYLHSSIRLVRGDAPVPPRPRKNDDLRLIDRRQRL